MNTAVPAPNVVVSTPSRLWPLLCFALLGALSAPANAEAAAVALAGLAGFCLGWLLLLLLGWVMAPFFGKVGFKGVKTAVSRGFLLLIPFAIFALAAQWGTDWQAAGAFASAGIMTSSTAVGLELSQRGGGKLRSSLLPVFGGAAVTTGWMVAITWLGPELARLLS